MKMSTSVSALRRVDDNTMKSQTGIFRLAESHKEHEIRVIYRNDASKCYFIYEHDGKSLRVFSICRRTRARIIFLLSTL